MSKLQRNLPSLAVASLCLAGALTVRDELPPIPVPKCTLSLSGECEANAQCSLMSGVGRCQICWRRSHGTPSYWDQHGGDANCVCITRDKEWRQGLNVTTCANAGGSWSASELKCYQLTHPGLSNSTDCTTNGGTWENGKCWMNGCQWVWL